MEGDGADVSSGDAALDGEGARTLVDGARRLQALRPLTLREVSLEGGRPFDESRKEGRGEKRHVPGDAEHGGGAFAGQRGVDPAQRAGPGDPVSNDRYPLQPGAGIGGVGDEQGKGAGDFSEELGDAVEDPAPADFDQALGAASESRGLPPGQDGALYDQ